MSPSDSKPYKYVAEIYSHLMRSIDYEEWAEYYYFLSKDYISSDCKVLELAGGNCRLSNNLKNYYKNLIVTDLSLEMLKKSETNNIRRICCNMLQLPFKTKFDFIFSAFDSINYLTSKNALNRLFQNVNNLLSDNGIFSFDVSLEKNSLKNARYLNRKGRFEGTKYIQNSFYDKEKSIHVNKFEISLANGEVIKEVHIQRIYPMEVYFELLIKNNFIIRQCYDAFTFDDADNESERIQFIVTKDKNYADI